MWPYCNAIIVVEATYMAGYFLSILFTLCEASQPTSAIYGH